MEVFVGNGERSGFWQCCWVGFIFSSAKISFGISRLLAAVMSNSQGGRLR